MGMFSFDAPVRELNEAERKWNLMWEMWEKGEAESPYAELMHYEGEVNNGGHDQYFFNLSNCGELKAEVEIVLNVLPEPLRENLKRGYAAFAAQEDICDDENEELFDECDEIFYENEKLLLDILKAYANSLSL